VSALPRLRPTWRAAGLGGGTLALGTAGAAGAVHTLVWFGVTIGCLLAAAFAWGLAGALSAARTGAVRVTHPPQLQVGRRATTTVAWPGRQEPPALASLLDTVPGTSPAPGPHLLRPTARGRMRLGPVHLQRRDPFGLFTWRTRIRPAEEVIVWPRTDGVDPAVFRRLLDAILGVSGLPVPQVDDVVLREYQAGDPLSRVYWKRAARGGALLVRQDEPARTIDIDLVLIPATPARTDRAVELLACAACELAAPERRLRLLQPRHETRGDLADLLDALALAPAGEARPPQVPGAGVAVVALADTSLEAARALAGWVASGRLPSEDVFVFPLAALEPGAAEALRHMTVLP